MKAFILFCLFFITACTSSEEKAPRDNMSPLHGAAHKMSEEEILQIIKEHVPTMMIEI